jgi:hypothetical protein
MVHDRQRREALERARRDGLTGLYTRAAFFEMAEQIDVCSAIMSFEPSRSLTGARSKGLSSAIERSHRP